MKKDMNTFISKDETIKRIECLIKEVNHELAERPVKEKVRKLFDYVDKKVESFTQRIEHEVKCISET